MNWVVLSHPAQSCRSVMMMMLVKDQVLHAYLVPFYQHPVYEQQQGVAQSRSTFPSDVLGFASAAADACFQAKMRMYLAKRDAA